MKILVTGAKGFIGKNLIAELRNRKYANIYEYDIDSSETDLHRYTKDCEFVFHLAGVNRPKDPKEFMDGNFGFTNILLNSLIANQNNCPIMISSSIQAEFDNLYGISKKAGEDLLFDYGLKTNSKILVYRFPNVFGKWCKPNYNSVVATFSYNIANGFPIHVKDPNTVINLVYIDDVLSELINAVDGYERRHDRFCEVIPNYKITLGEVAKLLYSFRDARTNLYIPNITDDFIKKLYSTYLSYLPKTKFSYGLNMNFDPRGSFTELLKFSGMGQVSINVSKPGIIKGNHWHHTKIEKFIVVSGYGVVRFRDIFGSEVIEYFVSGERLEVIDIPPGYTHNIENLGSTEMVTIIWANEIYNAQKTDTFFLEV